MCFVEIWCVLMRNVCLMDGFDEGWVHIDVGRMCVVVMRVVFVDVW